MTITIDETGRLSGDMAFPDGVVDVGGGADENTPAPDGDRDDRGDDDMHTNDVRSSDRQLVMISALAGCIGCCVLVSICLVCAVLSRSGTASVGPSPTHRPTKILVAGATSGMKGLQTGPFAKARLQTMATRVVVPQPQLTLY